MNSVENLLKLISTQNAGRREFLNMLVAAGILAGCDQFVTPDSSVTPNDELRNFDAVELGKLVRKGELAPLGLVDRSINILEKLEPNINALTSRVFEEARNRARTMKLVGPFAGVPFLFKDLIDVAGLPRTSGANEAFTYTPKASPDYVKSAMNSGLITLGATNTPEFATTVNTSNLRFGLTSNPWDLSRSVAGSSGGSAAAVAAGYVPMAHGTDGAGSLRLPASYCGVFGMKPSRARVRSGEADGRHDLIKHNHVLTRTVRDSAAMLAVTEDTGPNAAWLPIGLVDRPLKRRLRIGLSRGGMFNLTPDINQAAALENTVNLLLDLGHEIDEAPAYPVSGEEFWHHMDAIFLSRMPQLITSVETLTGQAFEDNDILSPLTTEIALHSQSKPKGARAAAEQFFANLTKNMTLYYRDMDVLLSPVQPISQFLKEEFGPNARYGKIARPMQEFMSYTAAANATGAPAMSVPLYWTPQGLPLGTHFEALPGEDKLLLELAYELEAARPWKHKWAPHSAYFGAKS